MDDLGELSSIKLYFSSLLCVTFMTIHIQYCLVIYQKFLFKVDYYANENPLKNSEKIAYVGQRLMYPIKKIYTLPR